MCRACVDSLSWKWSTSHNLFTVHSCTPWCVNTVRFGWLQVGHAALNVQLSFLLLMLPHDTKMHSIINFTNSGMFPQMIILKLINNKHNDAPVDIERIKTSSANGKQLPIIFTFLDSFREILVTSRQPLSYIVSYSSLLFNEYYSNCSLETSCRVIK